MISMFLLGLAEDRSKEGGWVVVVMVARTDGTRQTFLGLLMVR